jgi:hypothetical protein
MFIEGRFSNDWPRVGNATSMDGHHLIAKHFAPLELRAKDCLRCL